MEIDRRYLTEKEVSKITGIALSTLRTSRFKRTGITYSKISRSVRYSYADVIAYMESRKIVTEPITAGMKEGSHGTQDQA